MIRQYMMHNLFDRLRQNPLLRVIEKKWIVYQLLLALSEAHDSGVCHGDIKSENVLLLSWNRLYLADFAFYKPTFIDVNDPSPVFRLFFDSTVRRRCYLAPERFSESETGEGALTPSMDIFSAGCVIAELFLDGEPLFDLSQLIKYKQGYYLFIIFNAARIINL
jgi:phosphoinositide-3-kinase, regulatory subunit 4